MRRSIKISGRVEDFNRWAHHETMKPSVSFFTHPNDVKVEAQAHHYGICLVVLMTDYAGDMIYGGDDQKRLLYLTPQNYRNKIDSFSPK